MSQESIIIDFININPIEGKAIKRTTNLDTGHIEDIEIDYFKIPGIMKPPPVYKDDGRYKVIDRKDYF